MAGPGVDEENRQSAPPSQPSRAWAEVNCAAVADNLREIRRMVGPSVSVLAVVKANGYGHGAVPVARCALAAGATALGVATVDELLELRAAQVKAPILILNTPSPREIPTIVCADGQLIVSDTEEVRRLGRLARELKRKAQVHVAMNIGLQREGASPASTLRVLEECARMTHVELRGLMTHFPTPTDRGRVLAGAGALSR
ncbi:MAG: alanine racemase, partial [Myxococcales bacterium]|nr:alanine racemase [Myxococcales bacterium]